MGGVFYMIFLFHFFQNYTQGSEIEKLIFKVKKQNNSTVLLLIFGKKIMNFLWSFLPYLNYFRLNMLRFACFY